MRAIVIFFQDDDREVKTTPELEKAVGAIATVQDIVVCTGAGGEALFETMVQIAEAEKRG